MWSKVVLMHDMASRQLWELLLSILLSLVHFYVELLKISEILEEMMKILLRGSPSRSSKDKQSEENKTPKYNLPRTAEVRP